MKLTRISTRDHLTPKATASPDRPKAKRKRGKKRGLTKKAALARIYGDITLTSLNGGS